MRIAIAAPCFKNKLFLQVHFSFLASLLTVLEQDQDEGLGEHPTLPPHESPSHAVIPPEVLATTPCGGHSPACTGKL